MNNISITFRHVEPSDAIKQHAEDKVLKLQRFLRQPMSARITLSLEKLEQGAEIRISSGGEMADAATGVSKYHAERADFQAESGRAPSSGGPNHLQDSPARLALRQR